MTQSRTVIRNATLYRPGETIESGTLVIEDGKIAALLAGEADLEISSTDKVIHAEGAHLIPGMIDVHVHGGHGYDFTQAEEDSILEICTYHAQHGTTALLATTLTEGRDTLANAVRATAVAMQRPIQGARIWGIHLEGPYLNVERTGAQNPQHLRNPDLEELKQLWELSGRAVRLITIAPEIEGAHEVMEWAREQNITVSVGHSDATHEQMCEAIHHGATHVTHLFNGMRPLHHRDPGVAGTALLRDELSVELICDGIHVHKELIPWVVKQKPQERVVCVTDCVAAGGMQPGEYVLGGLPVMMVDGQVRLIFEDGSAGSLAGSSLTMHKSLLNFMQFTGKSLADSLPYFTINPARQAGAAEVKGSIEVGKDADLVLLDAGLGVERTFVEGVEVFRK